MKVLLKTCVVLSTLIVFSSCNEEVNKAENVASDDNPSSCSATAPTFSSEAIDTSKLSLACFNAFSNNAIISSGDYFALSHWNDPHVLKVGSDYVMYLSTPTDYFGEGNDVGIYKLTSSDGSNWNLSSTTPLLDRNSTSWATKAIETSAVVYFNSKYHMFFTGYATANESTNYRIGHATSCDGITWTADSSYLLGPTSQTGGAATDFNHYVVAEPAPVIFNDKIYLYFTAYGYHSDINDAGRSSRVTGSNHWFSNVQ